MTATLPPLPVEHHHDAEHLYFTADQMIAYAAHAAAYAAAAVEVERDACAALADREYKLCRASAADVARLIRARKGVA